MNKNQILLVILFSVGIIFIVFGLTLNSIRMLMTSAEIEQYHKELSESKFCHGVSCPSPPFYQKAPYIGIGQALYYTGTTSLLAGTIISIRNRMSISRQFIPEWIFFIGSIMTSSLLFAMPVRIPQLQSEPFCIDPLCPIGGFYYTVDPTIFFPLLYLGIIITIAGGIIYLIKMCR
ncbi:MAG: hypothetical protein KGH87_01965 [Thaumarchaeota archaeon]|nr:hypothetical protein [Nitrososphaerota archaeon]